ncbi:MAG: Rho termination factor N-terminal domain-containing protein [Oscillospiraceae bacterium]|jgi:hypothetical protein|nr:Rho termination factor N-terminal domain-containing protein [Oscillospiraceae bacterium]
MVTTGLKDGSYKKLSAELEQLLCTEVKLDKKKAATTVSALKELYETRPWRLDDIADFIEEHELDMTMEQAQQFFELALSLYNACPNKFEFDMGEYMFQTQEKHQRRMAGFREPPQKKAIPKSNHISIVPKKSTNVPDIDSMSQKDIVGLLGRVMSGEASQADLDIIEGIPGLMEDMNEFKEEMGDLFTNPEFMEVFEKHGEMVDEIVIKGKPTRSLKAIIGKKSVAELREFAPHMGIENAAKLKKAELVKAIYDNRLGVGARKLFELMPEEAFGLIEQIILGWVPVDAEELFEYPLLINSFIVAVFDYNGTYHCVVSEEIDDLLDELDEDEEFEEAYDNSQMLGDYAQAAVNLYGVIEIDKLVKMFESNGNTLPETTERYDLNRILLIMGQLRLSYVVRDGCLIAVPLLAEELEDKVDVLIKNHSQPLYTPDEETFLEYEDDEFFEESPATEAMEKFLQKVARYDYEDIMVSLNFMIKTGLYEDVNELIDGIQNHCKLSAAQKKKARELLTSLCENTRTWANNGFTDTELKK